MKAAEVPTGVEQVAPDHLVEERLVGPLLEEPQVLPRRQAEAETVVGRHEQAVRSGSIVDGEARKQERRRVLGG